MPSERQSRRVLRLVLTGVDGSRTVVALALAVGLGVGTALVRLYAPSTPGVGVEFALLHAFTLEASPPAMLTEGIGVLTLCALAGIHGFLNEGYIPSLVLATAPSYGVYVFNGPGAAPFWAATYVLPFAVTAGTVGFLLGIGIRWSRWQDRKPPFGQFIPR
ncbi:MAG: hypothetical protein ABEI52_00025 [Halobacteriaceae archaeon]